jgi:U4/U6.U5 tri-snRNP-associated protein 1
MADIDLEATNRLRVAMGLKPIPGPNAEGPSFKETSGNPDEDPASTLETREAAAGDNWAKLQAEAEARERRKHQKDAIRKARDVAQRNVKLSGKTLGEDDDELDTTSWLRQQGKRQKNIDKKRRSEEEMAARERENRAQYTAKDLAGVKVGHELDQFETGNEQILTLKDAAIGEESEDDELENLDMREEEKIKKKMELKKRKPAYNPMDDEEIGEKSILHQYDEEISGPKRNKFTLDGLGSTREEAASRAEDAEQSSKGVIISLDILRDEKPVSDYVDISEIKIKKPKKKKSKSTRKKAADDDDIFTNGNVDMEIDIPDRLSAQNPKKRSYAEANFVDDDDLQAKLAEQRREALKKKKRVRPEDLAKQLREEEEAEMDGVENVEEAPGLVLDETSEFVSHLQPEEVEERVRPKPKQKSTEVTPESDEDGDVEMGQSYADIKDEPEEQDLSRDKSPAAEDVTATGLEEETSITKGLGATLAMLRQRRLVEEQEGSKGSSSHRDHERFINEKRTRQDEAEREAKSQRERDRQSGRLDRMSARDREDYARQNNTRREQMESRAMADLFNKEYKPNINIKYIDEFGRQMNEKEAFKHLSHQFHGKGSGKQKHEKRLKKIDEEKKREAMNLLDSSQHTSSSAMGNKAKKNQQAGVRLQ